MPILSLLLVPYAVLVWLEWSSLPPELRRRAITEVLPDLLKSWPVAVVALALSLPLVYAVYRLGRYLDSTRDYGPANHRWNAGIIVAMVTGVFILLIAPHVFAYRGQEGFWAVAGMVGVVLSAAVAAWFKGTRSLACSLFFFGAIMVSPFVFIYLIYLLWLL